MYPFERFDDHARRALQLAQAETENSHHSFIGTEHLLLGLLREGDGLAAKVLANRGVEIGEVRGYVQSVLGRNERVIAQQTIPTSRVKKVIEIAFDEANRMHQTHVGTEHLLLGLLIEGEGIAARFLEEKGVSLEIVRAEVVRLEPPHPADVPPLTGPGPAAEAQAVRSGREVGSHRVVAQFGAPVPAVSVSSALTAEGRSVLALAEEECLTAGRMEVDPLDLLLAVVRHGRCRAADALQSAGVSERGLRALVRLAPVGEHSRELVLSNEAEAAVVGPGPGGSGAARDTAEILATLLANQASAAWRAVERSGARPEAVLAALEGQDGGMVGGG